MNAYKKNRQQEQYFPPQQEASGWDPYEVWRTRVLLPRARRLETAARDTTAQIARPKVLAA